MITIDFPISFVAGMGVALAARREASPSPQSNARGRVALANPDRALAAGLTYQGLFLTPVILYFMTRFPDWEWNYFFDAQGFFFGPGADMGNAARTPSSAAGQVIFVLLAGFTAASHLLGFWLAQNLIAHGREKTARRILTAVVVAILVITAILADRALHVGSYHQYHHGQAALIFVNLEFLVTLAIAGLVCILPLLVMQKSAHAAGKPPITSGPSPP